MARFDCDGVVAYIYDWDLRILSGWSYSIREGDEVRVKMETGKFAILKIKKIRRMIDPKDQYFADLEDVGYE